MLQLLLQGESVLHAHHGASNEHGRLQDHADGAVTRVFAARQALRDYPAQAGQKAYRVYSAQQGSQARLALQVPAALREQPASAAPRAPQGWLATKVQQDRRV